MEKQVVGPPDDEDDWVTKMVNFFSGGAVDEARAILAIDKMYAPGSKEKLIALAGISLRSSTSETFIAGNLSAWGNYRGTLSGTRIQSGSWAKTSGILRTAVKSKGNYGLGIATRGEANQAGLAWVGKGYTVSRDGSSWISKDGLRQYRLPSYKPKLGKYQANFQWRNINRGQWQSNGHLTIKQE